MCHFTCDTLGWIHSPPKYMSLALKVKEGMCLGDFEEKYKLLSHWINYEAIFSTTESSEWLVNNIELKIYVGNRFENISVF